MNSIMINLLVCLSLVVGLNTSGLQAQPTKKLTIEDIVLQGTFQEKTIRGINWMQDGRYYTTQVWTNNGGLIIKYDISTGNPVDTIFSGIKIKVNGRAFEFSGYQLSPDEKKILLKTDEESIYRWSTIANYYLYDIASKKISRINNQEKISFATLSPDGSHVAYVRKNNIFVKNLNSMQEIQVTTDGKQNEIINGMGDWVYEEEFQISQAFSWSPDSKRIAFFRFDEREVNEYNMQIWGPLYPEDYKFKYPKAGEKNAIVDIRIYDLDKKGTTMVKTGTGVDDYIPRIYWTSNPKLLSVVKLNRLQNEMVILHADVSSGNTKVVLKETSKTYVDINFNSDLIYLENNRGFLRTSEKDGFKHIYLHDMNGKVVRQITSGNWEVDEFYGFDDANNLLYFNSTESSPLERDVYRIDLEGKGKKKLSNQKGYNYADFSNDFTYFINYHSSSVSPLNVTLCTPDGTVIKELEDNSALKKKTKEYGINPVDFFSFENEEGVSLNGYLVKPVDFDSTKQYPVLMYVYGGPGHQLVLNRWKGMREMWHHYLTQQGYLVACIDNRGTGGRGKEFKDLTYANLGKLETADQIAGAKYLGQLPFVDETRIGIWGWSYGGYMSSLSILLGADYFKMAIAVAPVTSWRFYDTIYTERYLKTPQANPAGYDDYSPITHAPLLEDPFLIIHGTGDDNVHYQNAIEMSDALIASNKQFDMFMYPNRAHGISDAFARYHLFTLMAKYINDNL